MFLEVQFSQDGLTEKPHGINRVFRKAFTKRTGRLTRADNAKRLELLKK